MNTKIAPVDISIVILSKNEERYIGPTLDKIFRQDIDKKYEVVIIDSGSQDSTLNIARKHPVKILEIDGNEFGHGRTRNQGAQAAMGDIIVFLNADAAPADEGWLKGLIDNFESDERVAGVYSRIYPQPNCNPLRTWEILDDPAYCNKRKLKYIEDLDRYRYMNPGKKRNFLAFSTISCAIRKDILLNNPFKDIEFGEDLEWSKRIIERGFKIVFEPQSTAVHSHNFYFSFTKTFKKYFDDAKFNKGLFDMWTCRNFTLLITYMVYKVGKDMRYIFSLNKGILYKLWWICYSPIIRLAEFCGTVFGVNSKYLPQRLQAFFSLVSEIKKPGLVSQNLK